MTTIAYRDGVLAADSRECDEGIVVDNRCTKVFRLPDGRLFAAAGSSEDGYRLLIALQKNHTPPSLEEVSAILVLLNGTFWLYEGNVWRVQKGKFYALGTGAPFAYAAMKAGADARKAAAIGAELDPNSGGKVKFLRLRRARS
jgi:ATP-dependent protease HslVU (ClpYQ) peptidase subunit